MFHPFQHSLNAAIDQGFGLIGDGRLNDAPETIVEAYYSLRVHAAF
ncbi:MAG: hypothetical protein JSS58_00175 [Proteobacteria bacterium]|nr:hypothetical protein [Pseudomonadota bacterium]